MLLSRSKGGGWASGEEARAQHLPLNPTPRESSDVFRLTDPPETDAMSKKVLHLLPRTNTLDKGSSHFFVTRHVSRKRTESRRGLHFWHPAQLASTSRGSIRALTTSSQREPSPSNLLPMYYIVDIKPHTEPSLQRRSMCRYCIGRR